MKIAYDHDDDFARFSQIASRMQAEFDAYHVAAVKRGTPLHEAKLRRKDGKSIFPCGCTITDDYFKSKICAKHQKLREEGNKDDQAPTMAAYLTEGVDRLGHSVVIAVDIHPGPAVYHFLTAYQSAREKHNGAWGDIVSLRVRPFLLNHFYGISNHDEDAMCNARVAEIHPGRDFDNVPFFSSVEIQGENARARKAEKRKAAK